MLQNEEELRSLIYRIQQDGRIDRSAAAKINGYLVTIDKEIQKANVLYRLIKEFDFSQLYGNNKADTEQEMTEHFIESDVIKRFPYKEISWFPYKEIHEVASRWNSPHLPMSIQNICLFREISTTACLDIDQALHTMDRTVFTPKKNSYLTHFFHFLTSFDSISKHLLLNTSKYSGGSQ